MADFINLGPGKRMVSAGIQPHRYWQKTEQIPVSAMQTLPGTITRSGSYISSVALTGGKTYTVSRSGSYISSVTDGTKTWTFTRNGSNQITSWAIT